MIALLLVLGAGTTPVAAAPLGARSAAGQGAPTSQLGSATGSARSRETVPRRPKTSATWGSSRGREMRDPWRLAQRLGQRAGALEAQAGLASDAATRRRQQADELREQAVRLGRDAARAEEVAEAGLAVAEKARRQLPGLQREAVAAGRLAEQLHGQYQQALLAEAFAGEQLRAWHQAVVLAATEGEAARGGKGKPSDEKGASGGKGKGDKGKAAATQEGPATEAVASGDPGSGKGGKGKRQEGAGEKVLAGEGSRDSGDAVTKLLARVDSARAQRAEAERMATAASREARQSEQGIALAQAQIQEGKLLATVAATRRGEAGEAERRWQDADRLARAAADESTVGARTASRARTVSDYMARRATTVDQYVDSLKPAARKAAQAAARKWQLVALAEPKVGEASQDAFATNAARGFFAIADGVSQSEFPGELAQALVRHFVTAPPSNARQFRDEWLPGPQADRAQRVEPLIRAASTDWFNAGSSWVGYSTLIGVQLRDGNRRLQAIGMGDSELLIVRNGELLRSWPWEESWDFREQVRAIPSSDKPGFKVREAEWEVQPGDEVFMVTDALGKWALRELEGGRDPFPKLRQIRTQGEMTEFVRRARAGRLEGSDAMEMDDTTMIRFVVPATH
jgi:hypothetical protein